MLSFLLSPFVRLFHVILGLGTSQSFPPPLDAIEEDAAFRQSRTHPDPVRREEVTRFRVYDMQLYVLFTLGFPAAP